MQQIISDDAHLRAIAQRGHLACRGIHQSTLPAQPRDGQQRHLRGLLFEDRFDENSLDNVEFDEAERLASHR